MKKKIHAVWLTVCLPSVAFGAANASDAIQFTRTEPSLGAVQETYSTRLVTTTCFKESTGHWQYKINFHQPVSDAQAHKKLVNYARSLPYLYAQQQQQESKKRAA